MAFGVKWNETAGEKSCCDSAGQQGPGRGRCAPGADPAPGCGWGGAARRARRLHPPTRPQTGREGGGGGGTEPSAIFPYSPKHTDTLSGHRLGREQNPALARPARGGEGGAGKPPAQPAATEGGNEHTHTLTHTPPCTQIQLLAPERRATPARLATHRTTQASS